MAIPACRYDGNRASYGVNQEFLCLRGQVRRPLIRIESLGQSESSHGRKRRAEGRLYRCLHVRSLTVMIRAFARGVSILLLTLPQIGTKMLKAVRSWYDRSQNRVKRC